MSGRRTPYGILSATALVVAGMGVASFCHRSGEDVRARLVRLCEQVKAREAQRNEPRDAAWGETLPGSANDCYARAIRAAAAVLPANFSVNATAATLVVNQQSVSPERCAELRVLWTPALAALTDGAHRRETRPSDTREALLEVWRLMAFVTAEFVCRLEEGDRLGAVHVWLDGATFALDWQRGHQHSSVGSWRDEHLRNLEESEALVLSEGLARIDQRYPKVVDHERALAGCVGMILDETKFHGVSLALRLHAWRSGFDARSHQLEAIEELFEIAAVLSPAATDWPRREAQWRAHREQKRTRGTAWSWHVDTGMHAAENSLRMGLARLRLLRLAVAFHRGWPLPSLADPCGPGLLEVHADENAAAFRSAGSFEGHELFASRR